MIQNANVGGKKSVGQGHLEILAESVPDSQSSLS